MIKEVKLRLIRYAVDYNIKTDDKKCSKKAHSLNFMCVRVKFSIGTAGNNLPAGVPRLKQTIKQVEYFTQLRIQCTYIHPISVV